MKSVIHRFQVYLFGFGIGCSASIYFLVLYTFTANVVVPIVSVALLATASIYLVERYLLSPPFQAKVQTLIVTTAITFEGFSVLYMLPFSNGVLPDLRTFLFSFIVILVTTIVIIFVSYLQLFCIRYDVYNAFFGKVRTVVNDYYHSMNNSL